MDEPTQQAFDRIGEALDKEGEKLAPGQWFELLEELSGRVECFIDCYKEEHPEDFK